VMYTESKTLLFAGVLVAAGALTGFASCRSSKRSGALRFRDGRVLGGGGGAVFFAAGFFGAFFALAFALTGLAAFFGGGESDSSSSLRVRVLSGCARFLAMFDVVAIEVGSSVSASTEVDVIVV
jgi:hypothetical protein